MLNKKGNIVYLSNKSSHKTSKYSNIEANFMHDESHIVHNQNVS